MITGFFILPKALESKEKLIQYTIKTLKLYSVCIVLYLPINFYTGKLQELGIIGILKELLIEGTFYHLWYFPALILGIWITYFLIQRLGEKRAVWIVLILFLVGLLGDSYYGMIKNVAIIKKIYDGIFYVFNYTRNGIFFVPIFLYLGYKARKKEGNINKKWNRILLCTFLVCMVIEGLLLHYFNLQRHDSMYIFLIPTMIILFSILVDKKGNENVFLRKISMIIYLIHPIVIILVRGGAKVLHLERILVEQSVMHYLVVVIGSVTISVLIEWVKKKMRALR